jgi:uncharacterized protein
MNQKLTARSSLESFRKEAKRWLRALRDHEPKAHARMHRAWPGAPEQPGLRDVQCALAREYGYTSWGALKSALAEIALASSSLEKLAPIFLEEACIHYGIRPDTSTWDRLYQDHPSRWQYAARILAKHPEIARHSIHTAAVCGDLAAVQRMLAERPTAARARGGLHNWEPLLFVCYSRLPIREASDNAVAIARSLIDAGASVQVRLSGDSSNLFGPLTGAIGDGEFSQPPHPQAAALAAFLIEQGADPYDAQAMYNTSLERDDVFWLDFLYERSARLGETGKWTATSSQWPKSGILDYLLGNAVSRAHLKRAQWLLTHGANPDCAHYYTKRKVHTEALLLGYTGMADLLARFGAKPETLRGRAAFQAACMRLDHEAAQTLAREHPEYLLDPAPLIHAAARDLPEVARLLLDLGMSPNAGNMTNFRPLHAAASGDSVRVAALLIERGAEIDPVETRFNGVPLGWALHGKQSRMIALLGELSRNARALVWMGNLKRLRELFAEDPELAKATDASGSLFSHLPDDEDLAAQVAELLLAYGADPSVPNQEGLDAVASSEKRGLDAVVDILKSRGAAD